MGVRGPDEPAERAIVTRPRWRVPPRFSHIASYIPGRKAPSEPGNLASNEFPLGPSPRVVSALASAAQDVHRYPDPLADELRVTLGDELKVDPGKVLVGNGSDELIYLLMMVFGGNRTTVVTADPPYQLHQLVPRIFGAHTIGVPLVDWRHDLSSMAKSTADVAIVCNPHNPTGTTVSRQGLEGFVAESLAKLVVIDEAYIDFADEPEQLSALAMADRGEVVLLRSLSKSFALAGLRIGFLVASLELVDVLRKIRPPFSVNSFAQVAAVAALKDVDHREMVRDFTRSMRGRLRELVESFGYECIPSQANFILVRTPDEARFCGGLWEQGVSVRAGRQLGIPGTARVSVPSEAGLRVLAEALERANL